MVRQSLLVCVNELLVRPYFTDMFTITIANSHPSVATRLARIITFQLPSQQPRLASDSGRGGSKRDGQTSSLRALRPRRCCPDIVRSQRCIGRGRARTFGDRSWLGAAVAQSARACVRQVKVDRKDVGMVLRRSVPAIVHTLGRISQGLGRIGANGTMVIRMRVACWPDAGSCRLQRSAAKSCVEFWKGPLSFFGKCP